MSTWLTSKITDHGLRSHDVQVQRLINEDAKKSKTNIIKIPAATLLLPRSPDPWETY